MGVESSVLDFIPIPFVSFQLSRDPLTPSLPPSLLWQARKKKVMSSQGVDLFHASDLSDDVLYIRGILGEIHHHYHHHYLLPTPDQTTKPRR